MINIKCCKGCPDRLTGDQDCHGTCERYQEAKRKNDEIRERIREAKHNESLRSWNNN